MAKLKNLFIGCPVMLKNGSDKKVGTVVGIDTSDNTAWVSFHNGAASDDGWQYIEDLKLAPYPEPEKVVNHLEKFL